MEEQSFHEKEGLADSSGVSRLSESRPKFKPVLLKKLLADESDEDSDNNEDSVSDNDSPNSDNSYDELDNLDGCQPLPEERNNDLVAYNLAAKTADVHVSVVAKTDQVVEKVSAASQRISDVKVSVQVEESIDFKKGADNNDAAAAKSTERRSVSSVPLRLSDFPVKKSDEDKLVSGSKRSRDMTEQETAASLQWQTQTTLDKRKSLPVKDSNEPSVKSKYSPPDMKRYSQSMAANPSSESKDRLGQHQFESFPDPNKIQEPKRYSSASSIGVDEKVPVSSKIVVDQVSNTKTSTAHSGLNTTHGVMDTPVKHLQGSTRPNPCVSHRNIFQTPQNKPGNEYVKNSLQTPATIFSHWSQKHMAQTPMQNQIPVSRESLPTTATRDNMHTPATTCVQSQSARVERPRYYSVESKSVRRPLAETMFSAPVQGPQLPRLPEAANESQPSPHIAKDSAIIHDNIGEKKPVYSSSQPTFETKENKNPNRELGKSENHVGYQPPLKNETHGNDQPMTQQSRNSFHSQSNVKPKSLEYHNNAYPNSSNVQSSRSHDNYENYKNRESQGGHPPPPKQPEPLPPPVQPVQYAIPQQTNLYNNSRQKIITVKGQQYLVLSVIGQGMSCEVVRAQDLSNLDLRAIKCVNLNKMDKESVQGCLQEICMLDKLKAPCVVHMYNFEVKQPWVHVVMEIGDTDLNRLLKSMLAEKKKIPLTMILYYWTEMLTAVKHIHDNGVIHSDLKPANFLLVRGRLKLIDFGIASSINSDMTSVLKNCSIGTLNYVSPEALMDINAGSDSPNQNVKYKISYRSDVWSLGCILYSLVYGVTPFNHIRQQWGKISAITDPRHKINFPLVNGNEPVPLILVDVMRKCLQREPKARPTVADLLEIPYLQGNIGPAINPSIPSNILKKIKLALSDEEWKQFSETLEKR